MVVADDDTFVRTMLATHLASWFDCVGVGGDAMDAVALVEAHRPDVVVLDVEMPEGGAMFATSTIRERSPETAIVILSGDGAASTQLALRDAGATSYLHKDIDPRLLGQEIETAIAIHRRSASAVGVERAESFS
jgi:DNA-binding NarL/FixJ family response regulator